MVFEKDSVKEIRVRGGQLLTERYEKTAESNACFLAVS